MRMRSLLPLLALSLFGSGCSSTDTRPLPRPPSVDVPRFMGDWYVIAHIPSWPEREAFDAVESYALKPDGRIQTTFTYRKGSFDAPPEVDAPCWTGREGRQRRHLGHAVHLADPGRVCDCLAAR